MIRLRHKALPQDGKKIGLPVEEDLPVSVHRGDLIMALGHLIANVLPVAEVRRADDPLEGFSLGEERRCILIKPFHNPRKEHEFYG